MKIDAKFLATYQGEVQKRDSVYSGDADVRSGNIDPLAGLTSFWPCQKGTV
jgi:hypothetical protein